MLSTTLKAAAIAALPVVLMFSGPAAAKGPVPLVPTALVEDIKSSTTEIEFMDYVGSGQVIELAPNDTLVLSYLKSCQHETITGGTVKVGPEQSEVEGGKVARSKVRCDDGKIKLTAQQANASAAASFRLQSVTVRPILYATPPIVQVPKITPGADRTLVIERLNTPTERLEFKLGDEYSAGGFFDLAKTGTRPLSRGAMYTATLGSSKVTFKIDSRAKAVGKSGKAPPIVSRLLRFTPG